MDITYFEDTFDKREITGQQAVILGDYIKRYSLQGVIKKVEKFSNGLLFPIFYKEPNQTHQDILNAELTPDTKKLVIREIETFGDYMLEKDFPYNGQGENNGFTNALYDPNAILVATEVVDNGVIQYEYSSAKEYYDLNIIPDGPVFISEVEIYKFWK